MLLKHICEVCGKEEIMDSETAFSQGWDYPPKLCEFKTIYPRTCGDCGIDSTLWWELAVKKTPVSQLSQKHMQTFSRIMGEPENILAEPLKKKNSAVNNWFLINHYVSGSGFPTEILYKHFALPNDNPPLYLFGNVQGDPRFNETTTEFADGHRIYTGELEFVSIALKIAETKRTVYKLCDINPVYAEWLKR